MDTQEFKQEFTLGLIEGLKLTSLFLVIMILGAMGKAHAATELTPTHVSKYVCQPTGPNPPYAPIPATESIVTSRKQCIELAESNPTEAAIVYLINSATIVYTPPEPKEWLIKPYWNSNTRNLYDCDASCESAKKKGAKLGVSELELLGRCEGPLTPVWGSATNQWQFHTNSDGIRGLAYCTLDVPAGPDPVVPVVPVDPEPPVILPAFDQTSNGVTIFESQTVFKAAQSVWAFDFMPTDYPVNGSSYGLMSRDLTGQPQPGHFEVRIDSDGYVIVRMQDAAGGNSAILRSQTTVPLNVPVEVIVDRTNPQLVVLSLDGVEQDATNEVYPTSGNDLSLVLGASCQSCTSDANPSEIKWVAPFSVRLRIYTDQLPVDPDPVDPVDPDVYTATASWSEPTQNTDGTPINGPLTYEVRWGTTSGVYPGENKIVTSNLTTPIPLTRGTTYYLVVRSINDSGIPSMWTSEIVFTPPE